MLYKSDSLKTVVRPLSVAYRKKHCDMGCVNVVNNGGRLEVKHIYRRIDHKQLKARIGDNTYMHKYAGY